MSRNSWQLHRAGLLNYWYYDEQEFHFVDGRLLLRGDNGSGKSVTMQSFIPLLLDGKKSPDRLDPFGSRARKIEDYLLGEKGPDTPDERTGYIYLEFKQGELARYLTIGMGLKVKRGQSQDSWGFSITDNRRLGYDLFLYKAEFEGGSGKEEKIPLSYRELENRIGTGGQVVKGQEEYMKMVNQLLFGFESLEKYDELIKLLIQLRSPKLSKDFKPTVIYEILNNALPALSDDELRVLSETLENMDNLGEQVEHLENQFESMQRLEKMYTQYNRYIIYEKAQNYRREIKRYSEEKSELDRLNGQLQDKSEELNAKKERIAELTEQEKITKQKKEDLEEHDAISAAREKAHLVLEMEKDEKAKKDKDARLEEKERSERNLRSQIGQDEISVDQRLHRMKEILEQMDDLAEEGYYDGHGFNRNEFGSRPETYASFELWKNEVSNYRKRLEELLRKAREVRQADERQQNLQREVGNILARIEVVEREMEKSKKEFEGEKEQFVQSVFHWQKENRILIDLKAELQEMARLIPHYPQERYERLKRPFSERYHEEKSKIINQKLKLEHQHRLKKEEAADVDLQLEEWRNRKEPEPERHPEVRKAREILTAKGIPFVPLFAAVEFRAGVSETVKAQLEGVLDETGLLDTLILTNTDEEKGLRFEAGAADSYFKRNPQIMRPTLLDYLEPSLAEECGIRIGDVDEVLRSILIYDDSRGETFVSADGLYGIGLRAGKAPGREQPIFIGREARRKHRQTMLEKLMNQREALQRDLQEVEGGLLICNEAMQTLEQELRAFPVEDGMRDAFDHFDTIERKYKDLLRQQTDKEGQWKALLDEYQRLKRELQNMLIGEQLPPSEETIQTGKAAMDEYWKTLLDLVVESNNYRNDLHRIGSNQEKLAELERDLDDLRVEIRDLRQKLNSAAERVKTLEQQMRELGIEEINRQLSECIRILNDAPGKITQLAGEIGRLEENVNSVATKILEQKQLIEKRHADILEWERIFLEEAELLYFFRTQEALAARPQDLARQTTKELQEWVRNSQITRQKVTDNLNRIFYQELGTLLDYNLNLETIFVHSHEEPEAEGSSARDQAQRVEVTVMLQGKKIALYTFYRQLESELQQKRELMNEEDRHLYEDIILKGLGKTIQAKIQRADVWVKDMNRLMEERDTSSGLTFSLQWVSRGTRNDQEMSADELVQLLKRDPQLLIPEDLQRLVNHFRSRIQEARGMMEEKGYNENLHQAIKDVLDYRQWFRFVLSYQKEGQRKKELTNHVFDTFSGGEKAMAMYIPLFSAVYSHYTQAREDAPRLISLDEAFAGVDENNIRDMFALVDQLRFNFILNSQILWGDYDTIPQLAIAELIRPKNARCVSVIHYYWNGKIRALVEPGAMEMMEQKEVAMTAEV